MSRPDLYSLARVCLDACSIDAKLSATAQAVAAWRSGEAGLDDGSAVQVTGPVGAPGRPAKPVLVLPRELPKRGFGKRVDRVALIHALAHIEFNAVNLAWDAVWRFRDMPRDYYDDWVMVAEDEARHFRLLRQRLQDYGHDYGDLPAHNGLWEMAEATAHDLAARMALVPRVLEARSLDVTPMIAKRLRSAGDHETADIIALIEEEEVPHVLAGSRWFRHVCEQRGVDPDETFMQLVNQYMSTKPRGPWNRHARQAAGFSLRELDELEELACSS